MTEAHDPYQALRHPEYRAFLLGALAVFMAMQVQTVVMGWQVYHLTRDPMSLGWIGLAEALPFLVLILPAGHAADRVDRRLLSAASAVTLLAGALLLALAAPSLRTAWPFYAVQALAGLARAFYRPASMALGTELVPPEAYANAAAWRSSTFHVAMVVGPALGGLLCGFGSARLAYAVEAGLLVLGLASFALLRRRPRSGTEGPLLRSLGEGVRFVFSQQVILASLSLDLFAVLFGGALALLPAFALEVLRTGPQGLGLLRAAPAVGSVLMSLWLAHQPIRRRAGAVLLGSVALFGLTWIGFALSGHFGLSLALLALGGGLDNVSVVLRSTLVQTRTPQALMGRVQAVNSFFIGSSNELGAFESGLAARLLGLVPSVIVGGCMTLGVVAATARLAPELRKLDRA